MSKLIETIQKMIEWVQGLKIFDENFHALRNGVAL